MSDNIDKKFINELNDYLTDLGFIFKVNKTVPEWKYKYQDSHDFVIISYLNTNKYSIYYAFGENECVKFFDSIQEVISFLSV